VKPRFIILMGVAGCGKTTVGKALAERLAWSFFDADDFHPPENIARMAKGIPLTDADRAPWLATLHAMISSCLIEGQQGVLACSALKAQYREVLLQDNPAVQIIYLKGDYDLIWHRMSARQDHYMQPEMLKSQFAALDEPADGLTIDAALPVNEIVDKILQSVDQ
jgi:gluconokinase